VVVVVGERSSIMLLTLPREREQRHIGPLKLPRPGD
jgi:hypothetical protein